MFEYQICFCAVKINWIVFSVERCFIWTDYTDHWVSSIAMYNDPSVTYQITDKYASKKTSFTKFCYGPRVSALRGRIFYLCIYQDGYRIDIFFLVF